MFSSKDQLEELQYDVDNAIPDIDGWKAHILRAAHQDTAKSAVIENLAINQVLIIMDWAMKFLAIGKRETQRDWIGKKGNSRRLEKRKPTTDLWLVFITPA